MKVLEINSQSKVVNLINIDVENGSKYLAPANAIVINEAAIAFIIQMVNIAGEDYKNITIENCKELIEQIDGSYEFRGFDSENS